MKLILPTAAATLLLAAAPAHAAPYRVYGCDGPDDGPLSMHAFTQLEVPDRTVNHDDLCREPNGLAGFRLSAPGAQLGGWTLRAPTGATLTSLRWNGAITGLTGSRVQVEVDTDHGLAARWTSDLPFDTRIVPLPPGATAVALQEACNWPCQLGAWTSIRALSVTVDDPRPPAASGFAGLGPTAHGPAVLTFDAADVGSGLARAALDVDGTTRATALGCPPLPGDAHGYAAGQPCPLRAPVELRWETAGARDGEHTVSARLEDAAGNPSTVLGPLPITTDNAPPLPGHVTLTGTARAGATLTAAASGFDGQSPEYTYRWQRCPAAGGVAASRADGQTRGDAASRADGQTRGDAASRGGGADGCVDIDGVRGSRYVLGGADAGARVRVVVNARDLGGATAVVSAPSAIVAPAPLAAPTPTPSATPAPSATPTPAAMIAPPAPLAAPPVFAPLTAPRVTLARRTIRARYGKRVEIRGRASRAGAVLDVLARVRVPGARARRAGSVGTAADGRFSYVAPRGPSRDILIGGRTTTILVRAAGTVSTTRRGIRGRLKGGHVPSTGILVEIRSGGRRALVRTDRRGRFSARLPKPGFRVKALADGAWPFLPGRLRRGT